uniref:Uncharacterized protein n=1 Tax=viral metagenome TaxID=1070528 RepID=A0A6C0LE95_9ZZZZ
MEIYYQTLIKISNETILYPKIWMKNKGLTKKIIQKGPNVIITKIKSTGLFHWYNLSKKIYYCL